MLPADHRQIEKKTNTALAQPSVVLVGLIFASGILVSLLFILPNSHLIRSILEAALVALNRHLFNSAHFESIKESESRLPQFGERMFLLLFPKHLSESMLGDLSEEYAVKSARLGSRRARIWFYKELMFSIYHLMLHSSARAIQHLFEGRDRLHARQCKALIEDKSGDGMDA